MKLPEKIQLLRKREGLSQEQLAEQIGVSRQAISKWEAGQSTPELNNILMLCDIFHVTADELLSEECDLSYNSDNVSQEYLPVPTTAPSQIENMFCTSCGRENRADSAFCGYCGQAFKSYVGQYQDNGQLTKEDVELAYYRANLGLQQQAIVMQQQQYEQQAKCPWCGSPSLSAHKRGYSFAKGCLAAVITIPVITIISSLVTSLIAGDMFSGILIGLAVGGVVGPAVPLVVGLLSGAAGSRNVYVTCLSCGRRFKA